MIYIFRLHPFARLYLALILGWVAYTCFIAPWPMALFGILAAVLAVLIFPGLGRLTGAYFRTWRG
jgi:hypothetical protein